MATEKNTKTKAETSKKKPAASANAGAKPVAETPAKKVSEVKTTAPKKKTVPRLEDHMRVIVRSNQYGMLGFINTRTHERFFWDRINDLQDMTVGDIRDMRNRQSRFLEEGWVWIEAIDEPGFEDLTDEEIYSVLGLSHYFDSGIRPKSFEDVASWTVEEIKEKTKKMSHSTKTHVAIALNTEIRAGRLENLSRIKAWQEALGTDLDLDLH